MEEGTKVRLVRCPKCENLLPELPNVAVYQCGGCLTVLQAEKRPFSSGGSSEKSDDEKIRVSSEKLESFPEKGEGEGEDLSDASEVSKEESNGIKLRQRRREDCFPSGNSSSSSRTENKVVNENIAVPKYDPSSLEKETARNVSKYRSASKDPIDTRVLENGNDMIKSREELVRANMEKEIEPNDPQMGIASRARRPQRIPSWRSGERDGSVAYRRTPRAVVEDVRFAGSPYPDEGTSNYQPDSYGLVEPLGNSVSPGGVDRVEHLEKDRAELLKKLEELNFLKDQLARSGSVLDKPIERLPLDGRTVPLDPYVGRDTRFPQGSARQQQQQPSMQPFPSDKHAQRLMYSNHALEPILMMNRHAMNMQNFYQPLMHGSNEIPRYGDPFGLQMIDPSKPPHQYQQPSRNYFPAQYMDMDPDHNLSYPTNTFFHQPACSCVHCYNKHWHASAQVTSGVLQNRRFADAPTNPMFYQAENRGTFGPTDYNHRDTIPPPLHLEPQPLVRRQRDLNVEANGFGKSRPRRVLPVKRNGHRCFPIAGGAPFITCHNCFELLPLPRKVFLMAKNYRKLRCGACSSIISLLVESKRIVVSVPTDAKVVSPEVIDRPVEVVEDDLLHSHGHANHHRDTYSSDYDISGSGYNFHLTDTELDSSPLDRRLTLSESEKLQSLVSSCSTTSEDEESPDTVIARREVSNVEEVPLKAEGTPSIPGSPLHEYSSSNQVGGKFEKGNRSRRINREEVVPKKTSRQKSVKDVSVATEMDVSFNEYSNAGMSQEYVELSREEQPKISKGADSFFVGLIKKGFKDLSKPHPTGENDRSNVSINGQPMSERLLKKAEKQSGKIHPGQYWYDFRAGFWGVMGQPCRGIIPPFIEEFNSPMPTNCAGGNTGVYVNGRELHQNDLDLLANRGLPRATDKSYIIEISGKVVDADSGEELDKLGKLAPTVEKLKYGFGMRVPRAAA